LCVNSDYIVACRACVDITQDWSTNLLNGSKESKLRPDVRAKALTLGAKLIDVSNLDLMGRYKVHLLAALLQLQPEVQRETELTCNVRCAIQKLIQRTGSGVSRRIFR
jgi:hypothetical protein